MACKDFISVGFLGVEYIRVVRTKFGFVVFPVYRFSEPAMPSSFPFLISDSNIGGKYSSNIKYKYLLRHSYIWQIAPPMD